MAYRFSRRYGAHRSDRSIELIGIFGNNLLDDETQRDGFAQLCGLQEYKPFECVGEIAESAAVMSHLASHPDWREDPVVRQLQARFAALSDTWQDQEHVKFAEEFKQTIKALKKFVEVSNQHTPYLMRKAQRIEEYLNQR